MEFTLRQAETRLVEKSSRHKRREIGTVFPRKAARGTTLLRQQKRGFANAEGVAARLVPPQSQSATKSLEPPSFTDSETRISYCRGRIRHWKHPLKKEREKESVIPWERR